MELVVSAATEWTAGKRLWWRSEKRRDEINCGRSKTLVFEDVDGNRRYCKCVAETLPEIQVAGSMIEFIAFVYVYVFVMERVTFCVCQNQIMKLVATENRESQELGFMVDSPPFRPNFDFFFNWLENLIIEQTTKF